MSYYYQLLLLMVASVQAKKDDSTTYDCNGHILSKIKPVRITGCFDVSFIERMAEWQLSGGYDMNLLDAAEKTTLIHDKIVRTVDKYRKDYNKVVEKKTKHKKKEKGKDETSSLKTFDNLSKNRQTVLLFGALQFGRKNFLDQWNELTEQQEWDKVSDMLYDIHGVTQDTSEKKFLSEAVALLDTDDDSTCCPNGKMYEGHCYFLGDSSLPVEEARGYCHTKAHEILKLVPQSDKDQLVMDEEARFGDLPSIHGKKVLAVIGELAGNNEAWVGAFKCGSSGNFKWTDEEGISKSDKKAFWEKSHSEEFGCAVYDKKKITEHTCDNSLPFVCELAMPLLAKADVEINKHEIAAIRKKARVEQGALAPILNDCKNGEEFEMCDQRKSNSSFSRALVDIGPEQTRRKKRNAIAAEFSYMLWQDKYVPITIDEGVFNEQELANITEAIDTINALTCLNLYFRVDEYQYIEISRGWYGTTGCWSYIGKADPFGPGPFALNLDYGCTLVGTVLHELIHSLGFVHEHTRPDRDDYVDILWDNVQPGTEGNFQKYTDEFVQHMNHAYDYDSVMHYGMYSLSATGFPTILPTRPLNVEIGQRNSMTPNDVAEINNLYDCQVPVDGAWAHWSHWEDCNLPCGTGVRSRNRSCTLPFPMHGGLDCPGSELEFEECNTDECNSEFHWAGCWKYTVPGDLHNLDGDGLLLDIDPTTANFKMLCSLESQSHNCPYFAIQNNTCFAFDGTVEMAVDELFLDPSDNCNGRGSDDAVDIYRIGSDSMQAYYGAWQEYSLCTVTCGGGIKTHTRKCNNPPTREDYGDLDCEGEDTETVVCNDVFCPVNGQWGEWSEWGDCDVECGLGTKERTRMCDNPEPEHGGFDCDVAYGNNKDVTSCNSGNCPAVEGCPAIKNPEQGKFLVDPFEDYSSKDKCEDGGIAGLLSELKLRDPDMELTQTSDGAVTFGPGQNLIGEFSSIEPCIFHPETCKPGFGIELSVNRNGPAVNRRKRSTIGEERSMIIFTTGVNTDTDRLADESQGIVIYFTHTGELRATVLITYTTYTVDLPGHLFDQDKFFEILVHWSRLDGLWIAYQGVWFDSDQNGTPHHKPVTNVVKQFCVGGPCSCQTDQYFSGYLAHLSLFNNIEVDTEVPLPHLDFSCDTCAVNANCNVDANTCTCRAGFDGDGTIYCTYVSAAVAPSLPTAYLAYKWPDTFNQVYNDSDLPGFQNGDTFVGTNLVRMPQSNPVLVFNGQREYIHGGDRIPCYSDPGECADGITVSFTMVYYGRGIHYNFIFSTGSMPWYPTTGMSMYVENDMATVQLQTKTTLYQVQFVISFGVRQKYIISWSPITGLTVYVDSSVYHGSSFDKVGSANFYGDLIIGKPSIEHVVYNGRFEMEAFHLWLTSVEPVPVY